MPAFTGVADLAPAQAASTSSATATAALYTSCGEQSAVALPTVTGGASTPADCTDAVVRPELAETATPAAHMPAGPLGHGAGGAPARQTTSQHRAALPPYSRLASDVNLEEEQELRRLEGDDLAEPQHPVPTGASAAMVSSAMPNGLVVAPSSVQPQGLLAVHTSAAARASAQQLYLQSASATSVTLWRRHAASDASAGWCCRGCNLINVASREVFSVRRCVGRDDDVCTCSGAGVAREARLRHSIWSQAQVFVRSSAVRERGCRSSPLAAASTQRRWMRR